MIPQAFLNNLVTLGLNPSIWNLVLDFLTNRPQSVCVHGFTSSPIILNSGSPKGYVLSPLLVSLLSNDCSATHPSCHVVKFADNTAGVGHDDKAGIGTPGMLVQRQQSLHQCRSDYRDGGGLQEGQNPPTILEKIFFFLQLFSLASNRKEGPAGWRGLYKESLAAVFPQWGTPATAGARRRPPAS